MTKPDIIWIDKETTGLSAKKDNPLEIGMIATTWAGEVIDQFESLIWYPGWHSKVQREPFVLEMHTKSGLVDELLELEKLQQRDYYAVERVEARALQWLEDLFPGSDMARMFPMSGASVHFDRAFALEHMPKLHDWFHYGNMDLSTIRVLAGGASPAVRHSEPAQEKLHRVISDITDTIRLYRYYLVDFIKVDYLAPATERNMTRDSAK